MLSKSNKIKIKVETRKRKPKILVFEDDPFIKDIYFQKFLQFGFEVKSFEEYLDVVKLVTKEKPDILFIDILVSGEVDGFEAVRLLKDNERTREVPVIIVSNLDNRELVEKGLSMGAVNYLIKALYDPSELAGFFTDHLIKTGKFNKEDFNY